MNQAENLAALVAELDRCLAERAGRLSQEEIDRLLAAHRAVLNVDDLTRLGLALVRALNTRLRQEIELRRLAATPGAMLH